MRTLTSAISASSAVAWAVVLANFLNAQESASRIYSNTLTPLVDPPPLLADYPEFIEPVRELRRFEAPVLVNDDGADLSVRAWRYSYNARGIIEMPNRLRASRTAVIMVHPWGIDDGQGWNTPEPAGVADFCTVEKNKLAARHTREVIDPLLAQLRSHVAYTLVSLPGKEDPIRKKLYRSVRGKPTSDERQQGARELAAKLSGFEYRGQPLVEKLTLSADSPVRDYFRQFPGLDSTAKYNNSGFWDLPIPVTRDVTLDPNDIMIYDAEGYDVLKEFLQRQGVRHVLLTGYATDMCFCRTTAGYENLSRDFSVFLVGDATLATFPANATPKYATNAHISFASLNQLITQASWIQVDQVPLSPVVHDRQLPKFDKPILGTDSAADAIVAAMQIFPPDNPWNTDVSQWPVHPNSTAIVASIGNDKPLRYNTDMAYVLVPPDQKRVEVALVGYPDESDKGPFPIPDNLPIEGWPAWFTRDMPGKQWSLADVQHDRAGLGGDRHAIVVDPHRGELVELYQAKLTDRGWQAACAAKFDLTSNKLRPDGWTSSDAAGLPIFPAIIRADELKRGMVNHAMRVTVRNTRRAYVAPATHFASSKTDPMLPRMGERLRLKADYDISSLSPEVQAILKGLKKYGMLVADNGLDWALSCSPDERIPVLHDELRRVNGAAFEVVQKPK
jgi:nicotinamidase-related amidase